MTLNAALANSGSSSADSFVASDNLKYYFGLQGDDVLSATSLSTSSSLLEANFFVGGSGSDTYTWDGTGLAYILETGGDNDIYIDAISQTGNQVYGLEVESKHLLLTDFLGAELLFLNYADPDAKIETFQLWTSATEQQQFTNEQFVTALKASTNWLGSYTYTELGISTDVASSFDQLITDVGQYASSMELNPPQRDVTLQDASAVARLYNAAFDRLPDSDGLNYWIDQWEQNISNQDIAFYFYNSTEFTDKYGSPTNQGFVELLYNNVLDRGPDESGLNYWLEQLDQGANRSDVLLSFSDSVENIANTEQAFANMAETSDGFWSI